MHASSLPYPTDACEQPSASTCSATALMRALVAARSLPEPGRRPRTLRIDNMTEPPLNWLRLAEPPDAEVALGQIANPWQPGARQERPADAEEFRRFDQPGYAKIVLGVHAERRDDSSSLLTVETPVRLTDAASRRRFRRFWLLVRPFSAIIRRIAMHALASELGGPARPRITGAIDIARPAESVFEVVAHERNEPRFNPRLRHVEKLTPGPIGRGTRFQAQTQSGRRTTPVIIEIWLA